MFLKKEPKTCHQFVPPAKKRLLCLKNVAVQLVLNGQLGERGQHANHGQYINTVKHS